MYFIILYVNYSNGQSSSFSFDVAYYMFMTWVWVGSFLILLIPLGAWVGTKRTCWCHWFFAFLLLLVTLFYLFCTCVFFTFNFEFRNVMNSYCNLSTQSQTVDDYLDKVYSNDNNYNKTVSELYSRADKILWVSSGGCKWKISRTITSPSRTYSTSITGVTKTQDWTAYLQSAYSGYDISASSLSDYQAFLNLMGDIESKYNCSGIWSTSQIYYFSNTDGGAPTKRWLENIQNDIVQYNLYLYGFLSAGISFCLLIILSIQYGLCCRCKRSENRKKKN